jgi:transposase-like protein
MRQAESSTPVPEVCRKMGIAEQTFYRWKKKFAGMGVAEVRRLKVLEEENQVETAGGRPKPGQADASGCAAKKP